MKYPRPLSVLAVLMAGLCPGQDPALAGLNVQYCMLTSDRAALRVRSLRLEPAAP